MFNYSTAENQNIRFLRYSSNNKHNFININRLNKNNPYIGYFSQFNNKKVINKNVFSNINNSWYPYYKINPIIRCRLVPSLGTNIILSDETINEAIYKSYLNFTYS